MTSSNLPKMFNLPRGDQQLWTSALDVVELQRHVAHCRSKAPSTKEKGARLEQLMCWLIPHIPGFEARSRDQYSTDRAQEIDVAFWNHKHTGGFPQYDQRFFGECKNWTRKVDSSDVAWFDWKMQLGGVGFGILIAANGVTADKTRRDYAISIIAAANAQKRTIIVLTLDEIQALTSTDDLRNLIIDKSLSLALRKPFA